jgi:hypothetical protein
MIYFTTIGLTPGGSSTVHIDTQTVHKYTERNIHNNKKMLKIYSLKVIMCTAYFNVQYINIMLTHYVHAA